MKHTVVVIDDDNMMQYTMNAWLSKHADFEIIGTALSGAKAVALCKKLKPDIALLDINMPDMNGFEVAEKLQVEAPLTRIIIISSLFDPFCIYRVAQLGVPGYVDKGSSLAHIERALRQVTAGKTYYAPVFGAVQKSHLSRTDAFNKVLTPKELSILILIATALDDKTISDKLGISPSTLTTHKRNLHIKLHAHNDRDLLAYALEWGLTREKANWIG